MFQVSFISEKEIHRTNVTIYGGASNATVRAISGIDCDLWVLIVLCRPMGLSIAL
jgi:hypothetical protein